MSNLNLEDKIKILIINFVNKRYLYNLNPCYKFEHEAKNITEEIIIINKQIKIREMAILEEKIKLFSNKYCEYTCKFCNHQSPKNLLYQDIILIKFSKPTRLQYPLGSCLNFNKSGFSYLNFNICNGTYWKQDGTEEKCLKGFFTSQKSLIYDLQNHLENISYIIINNNIFPKEEYQNLFNGKYIIDRSNFKITF